MGLSSIIQKATQTAFKAIGDIPVVCSYTFKYSNKYKVATGVYTTSEWTYDDIKVLFENYSIKEIQQSGGTIQSTDQKASIPSLSLSDIPHIGDLIIVPGDLVDVTWTVENIQIDPANALWVFQVRLVI